MEKLVTYYPKKEYWVDLLSRLQRKPNFSDRLSLDTYRLSLATGSMSAPADYMEMAQLALQADLAERRQAGRRQGLRQRRARHRRRRPTAHKRLRDLVDKQLDEDKAASRRRREAGRRRPRAATRWSRSA